MDELESYEDMNAAARSDTTVERSRPTWMIPAGLAIVVATVVGVSLATRSGDDAGGASAVDTSTTTTVDASPATSVAPDTSTLEPSTSTTTPTTSSTVDDTAATADPSASATEETPTPRIPNDGIEGWLFELHGDTLARSDLATGERVTVAPSIDFAGETSTLGAVDGRMVQVGGQLVITTPDQLLLVDPVTLDVGALPYSDMRIVAAGDDEVWTATGPVFQENRQFHRVPIDGSPVLDIDMDLAAPFPFLIVAPVEGGLLFSELLGATWLVSDAGDVSRQDEISAVLASGSEAFVAISCAPNALSCDATIHDRQGTQRPAVINDNFVFGTPLSPDGRWLPTEFGFVDMETGQRRSLPSSGLGQGLNSWSQNGRWFAQSGERDITIHDMDGELLPLELSSPGGGVEVELVLR